MITRTEYNEAQCTPAYVLLLLLLTICICGTCRDDSDNKYASGERSNLLSTRPAECPYFYVPSEYTDLVFMTDPQNGEMAGTMRMICVSENIDADASIIRNLSQLLARQGWTKMNHLFRSAHLRPGWQDVNVTKDGGGTTLRRMWLNSWIDTKNNVLEASIQSLSKLLGEMDHITLSMTHYNYSVWKESIDAYKERYDVSEHAEDNSDNAKTNE